MSHFTCLVITDGSDGSLEKALQPYHEYECTGVLDEYVIRVDVTDEVDAELAEIVKTIKLADGKYVDQYNDAVYVELPKAPDAPIWESAKREYRLPEGAVELEMTRREQIAYREIPVDEWISDQFGYEYDVEEDKFFRMTNPNAKWDWWQIGGRWSNYLPTKTDIARKGDLDYSTRREEARQLAATEYDKVHSIVAGRKFVPWRQVVNNLKEQGIHESKVWRDVYRSQEALSDLEAAFKDDFFMEFDEYFEQDRESYIDTCGNSAGTTYAMIHEGKWYQRGEMGWFGMSNDEMTKDQWNQFWHSTIESLADDMVVTVVDCHI